MADPIDALAKDPELTNAFVTEANEKLKELDELIDHIKNKPADQDIFAKIMRALHTIKGSAGFLGLDALENITHHAESVVMRIKDGDLRITDGDINLLQTARDAIQSTLTDMESGAPILADITNTIGMMWATLLRAVKQVSDSLGKKVELHTHGGEIEVEPKTLKSVKDPLVHMVRNSVDHGIEAPEQRAKAGKPETGSIDLNAFHDGENLVITISDDGQGLSLEDIKAKAIEKGLVSAEEIATMDDADIYSFVFHPDFSTAESVSKISGRGTGLDIARTNIEELGGTIALNSIAGKGATFTIKIPQKPSAPIASE